MAAGAALLRRSGQYPTARVYVKDVEGAEGVFFYVSNEGTKTWGAAKNSGQIHGGAGPWAPTSALNLQAESMGGRGRVPQCQPPPVASTSPWRALYTL